MSFSSNDNHLHPISRNNYEEHFILYADNELSGNDRLAVEAFVLANPDLQAELDLFLSTKLPKENIHLQNKETLLAHNMKLNSIDESLLLYIDNELNAAERKLLEEKLVSDKTLELQYKTLLKTKLEPEEIVYPYKKELYHYEKKRRFVFSAYWMRIAAAVIILLGMGLFWATYEPKPTNDIATIPDKTIEKSHPGTEPSNKDARKSDKEIVEPAIKVDNTDDVINLTRNIEKKSPKKENKSEQGVQKPSIKADPNTIARTIEENKPEQKIDAPKNTIASGNAPANSQQQTLNNKNVTSPSVPSLNDQTTDAVTAVHASVVEPDDEKKSKLKGILRKATRFIERRTNISTTNENNELLIGAVAIQL